MKKFTKASISVAAATALLIGGMGTAPAAYAAGNVSLATALDAGNAAFDTNWGDFDVLTAAVNAVLGAKPDSAVKALTQGEVGLTAFAPTDRAFKKLTSDLKFKFKGKITEAKVFAKLAATLGIDTIEKVLLYHVVVGNPIDSAAALMSDGATLTTAEGSTLKVRVSGTTIRLGDKSKRADPTVILTKVDINKGNNQIAHGITAVLLPKL